MSSGALEDWTQPSAYVNGALHFFEVSKSDATAYEEDLRRYVSREFGRYFVESPPGHKKGQGSSLGLGIFFRACSLFDQTPSPLMMG